MLNMTINPSSGVIIGNSKIETHGYIEREIKLFNGIKFRCNTK